MNWPFPICQMLFELYWVEGLPELLSAFVGCSMMLLKFTWKKPRYQSLTSSAHKLSSSILKTPSGWRTVRVYYTDHYFFHLNSNSLASSNRNMLRCRSEFWNGWFTQVQIAARELRASGKFTPPRLKYNRIACIGLRRLSCIAPRKVLRSCYFQENKHFPKSYPRRLWIMHCSQRSELVSRLMGGGCDIISWFCSPYSTSWITL